MSILLEDYSHNCNIFDKYLYEDLVPYSINQSSLVFSNGTTSNISINTEALQSLYNEQGYGDISPNVWYPVFITHDNFINNKVLSNDGAYQNQNGAIVSGRIGIENFISFQPQMNNWTTSSPMVIDWIINKASMPYNIYYGLLFWFKVPEARTAKFITRFAPGTRLSHANFAGKTFIKIDNDWLYEINNDASIFSANSIDFNDSLNKKPIGDFGNNPVFTEVTRTISENRLNNTTINNPYVDLLGNGGNLWIPDGDIFSYHKGESEKAFYLQNGIFSRSYTSVGLHKFLREIYHILTAKEPKLSQKPLKRSRFIRKLSSCLSTSPFVSKFDINAMYNDYVYNLINGYISSIDNISSVYDEVSILRSIILDISKFLQSSDSTTNDLELDKRTNSKTHTNNFIVSTKDIFEKMLSKYGATVHIVGSSSLSYNTPLKYGAGVDMTQVRTNLVSKNGSGLVTINEAIRCGNLTVSSDLSRTNTTLQFKMGAQEPLEIPLADLAKPRFDEIEFNIVMQEDTNVKAINMLNDQDDVSSLPSPSLYIYRSGGGATIPLSVLVNGDGVSNTDRDTKESRMTFTWDIISGCGNFGGGNSDTKAPTSNDPYPVLNISQLGRYVIRCRIDSPFGTVIKTKEIYVVNGLEKYRTGNNFYYTVYNNITGEVISTNVQSGPVEPTYGTYEILGEEGIENVAPDPQTPLSLLPIFLRSRGIEVLSSSLTRIALHKHGIFWPINTSFKVSPRRNIVQKLDQKYKFIYTTPSSPVNSGAAFSISYNCATSQSTLSSATDSPASASVKVSKIILNNVRNGTVECSQCLSVCRPTSMSVPTTTVREGNVVQTERMIKQDTKYGGGYGLEKFTGVLGGDTSGTSTVSFDMPSISTEFAAPIKSYGGYSREVIDKIGLEIPDHPRPFGNSVGSANRYIATNPRILENVVNYPLNNNISSDPDQEVTLGPKDYKICYQKDINPKGYLEFTKGTFDPSVGWIPHTSSLYDSVANRTSVLKFRPGARQSHSFLGPGLKDLDCGYSSDGLYTQMKIHKASINISLARHIRYGESGPDNREPWPEMCTCPPRGATQSEIEALDFERFLKNKSFAAAARSVDQSTFHRNGHGYRILNGGAQKRSQISAASAPSIQSDEFLVKTSFDEPRCEIEDGAVSSEGTAVGGTTTYSYEFTQLGPESDRLPYTPKIFNIDQQEYTALKKAGDPRINEQIYENRIMDASIADMEVKLNFLNYANIKDLSVWLEVGPDAVTKTGWSTQDGPQPPVNKRIGQFLNQSYDTVQSYGSLPGPTGDLYYKRANKTVVNNVNNLGFGNYLNNLIELHSSKASDIGRDKIHLLNQEHISYNGFNQTILFSDHAPKQNVGFDHNVLNQKGFSVNQHIIKSSESMQPTLFAKSHNDIECVEYSNIIRSNDFSLTNNYFSKFYGFGLFRTPGVVREPQPCCEDTYDSGTSFVLNIGVVDEPDMTEVLDNTIDSEFLSGFTTSENIQKSSSLFNSICNWELILHIDKTRRPTAKTTSSLTSLNNAGVLGLIEYGRSPRYDGYNFIANLADYKFLLPTANIDAPHTFIDDNTLCTLSKPSDAEKGYQSTSPRFPTEALLQILVSTVGPRAGSIVGTLAGLTGIDTSAIIDYFGQLRQAEAMSARQREIYTLDYSAYPFGSPEKILLNVSKDGGIWYKLEASIFKYKNTPILPKNEYEFLVMKRNSFPLLSNLKFSVVSDIVSLIDSFFTKDISINCSDLNFEGVSVDTINSNINTVYNTGPVKIGDLQLKPNDMIKVSVFNNTEFVTNNTCSIFNGLYIVTEDSWVLISPTDLNKWTEYNPQPSPSNIYSSVSYLNYNSVLNNKIFDNIYNNIVNQKIIMVKGKLAYQIFDVTDKVECYNASQQTDTTVPINTVVKKGLIIKDNTFYSILVMEQPVGDADYISPYRVKGQKDKLIVLKNGTTIDGGRDLPINQWSLEKDQISSTIPQNHFTTTGTGAVGDMSPLTVKNILTNYIDNDYLPPIYEILNNSENNKIKYNDLSFILPNGSSKTYSGEVYGFTVSIDEINDIFDTSTNFIFRSDIDNIERSNILRYAQDSIGTADTTTKKACMIVCASTSDYATINEETEEETDFLENYNYGKIYVDQDYVKTITNNISTSNFTLIKNRILKLEDTTIPEETNKILGIKERTSSILSTNQINIIEKHLASIEDDPADCYKSANAQNCYKKLTTKKLRSLYTERANLLKAIDGNSIVFVNLTYIDIEDNFLQKTISGELLYQNETSLVLNISNVQTTIMRNRIVNFNISNITQKYTPADVIYPTETIVTTNNDGSLSVSYQEVGNDLYWINIDANQSCSVAGDMSPKILIKTKYRCSSGAFNISNIQMSVSNNICPDFILGTFPGDTADNINETFKSEVQNYTYEFSDSYAQSQKGYYESLYPSIKGWKLENRERVIRFNSDNINTSTGIMETILYIEETYWVALPIEDTITDPEEFKTKLEYNDHSIDIESFQGRRIGLVDTDGQGVGKPTKVVNIFNLDSTNSLMVNFKKVIRQSRGHDLSGTVFRYGSFSTYRQTNAAQPPGPTDIDVTSGQGSLFGELHLWHCYKVEDGKFKKDEVSPFLKLQNEMEFRSAYGSTDQIQNKNDVMESLFQYELIPYEFFDSTYFSTE